MHCISSRDKLNVGYWELICLLDGEGGPILKDGRGKKWSFGSNARIVNIPLCWQVISCREEAKENNFHKPGHLSLLTVHATLLFYHPLILKKMLKNRERSENTILYAVSLENNSWVLAHIVLNDKFCQVCACIFGIFFSFSFI